MCLLMKMLLAFLFPNLIKLPREVKATLLQIFLCHVWWIIDSSFILWFSHFVVFFVFWTWVISFILSVTEIKNNAFLFLFVDYVQLGFLPRNVAKWVSPLWDAGFLAFSGYVYPKEALAAASGENSQKVQLILNVSEVCWTVSSIAGIDYCLCIYELIFIKVMSYELVGTSFPRYVKDDAIWTNCCFLFTHCFNSKTLWTLEITGGKWQ